jgi:hypothetical protein
MKSKKLMNSCLLGSAIVLVAAFPAFADNSSTSATSSDNSGYSFDPELPRFDLGAGAVEIRKQDVSVAGGQIKSGETSGKTVSAKAKVNLHLWGSEDTYGKDRGIHGFLVAPSVSVRFDRMDDKAKNNTEIDIGGIALYRGQGSVWHASTPGKARLAAEILTVSKKIEPIKTKYKEDLAALENDCDNNYSRCEQIAAKAKYEIAMIVHRSPLLVEAIQNECDTDESCLKRPSEYVAEYILSSDSTDAVLERGSSANPSEAHSSGDITVLSANYRYRDNKRTGVKQNGVMITVLKASGHTAFRINDVVNVGINASADIGGFAGKSNIDSAYVNASAGADLTIGALPTVRNTVSVQHNWNMSDDVASNNSATVFTNRLSGSKKIGPVTPELGWEYGIETPPGNRSDEAIRTHMFTGGVSF